MLEHVWVPEWLYKWLHRYALLAGFCGIMLIAPSFFWTPVSLLTMGYGGCVMAIRAC